MASIKAKFRPSHIDGHEGSIYFQIIHERRVRQIVSNYKILPGEWDSRKASVNTSDYGQRQMLLLSIRDKIRRDIERLTKIDRRLEAERLSHSADDIIEEFNRYSRECTLFNFMERIIDSLRDNGRLRTSETYTSALNNFRRFRRHDNIMLDALTPEVMEAYEAWNKRRGMVPNTISFYNRILRAVYNRAVEYGLIENRNPFRRVYTGVDKTVKRALTLPVLRRLKALNLSLHPELDHARDMFMMSFYLRGMSFIDMAFLKKTDLMNGYVAYRRRKTGRQLVIAWTKEMQQIVKKHGPNTSEYLLPIFRQPMVDERKAYRNMHQKINYRLRRVAAMVDSSLPLTLYVARHSWATAARTKGVPISVISEGMGHDSETTTQIYLSTLDTSLVDKANALILKSI